MKPRKLITHLAFLILITSAPFLAADETRLEGDGWYSWEVTAGKGGQKSCCYSFNNGNVVRKGCRLGHGMDEFSITGPCDETSGSMRVFVEVRNGNVREIRPLSSACPVKSDSEIRVIENVSGAQSVSWLKEQIEANPKVADEAIMTLSFGITRRAASQTPTFSCRSRYTASPFEPRTT